MVVVGTMTGGISQGTKIKASVCMGGLRWAFHLVNFLAMCYHLGCGSFARLVLVWVGG